MPGLMVKCHALTGWTYLNFGSQHKGNSVKFQHRPRLGVRSVPSRLQRVYAMITFVPSSSIASKDKKWSERRVPSLRYSHEPFQGLSVHCGVPWHINVFLILTRFKWPTTT